jgi:mono/diheme cytochrome c family protein
MSQRGSAQLFRADGCIRCHAVNGYGGIMGQDLSRIGSRKSLSWITTQIVYPLAHFKRGSQVTINGETYTAIMPNYEHLPKSQVIAISKYLESLK